MLWNMNMGSTTPVSTAVIPFGCIATADNTPHLHSQLCTHNLGIEIVSVQLVMAVGVSSLPVQPFEHQKNGSTSSFVASPTFWTSNLLGNRRKGLPEGCSSSTICSSMNAPLLCAATHTGHTLQPSQFMSGNSCVAKCSNPRWTTWPHIPCGCCNMVELSLSGTCDMQRLPTRYWPGLAPSRVALGFATK